MSSSRRGGDSRFPSPDFVAFVPFVVHLRCETGVVGPARHLGIYHPEPGRRAAHQALQLPVWPRFRPQKSTHGTPQPPPDGVNTLLIKD